MKKSFLALAIAALTASSFAASTASAATVYDKDGTSLDVYGRVQAVYYSSRWNDVTDDNGGSSKGSINTSARLGLEGRTQLFNGVSGFGKAEWDGADGNNVKDSDDNFRARYLWVGLDFGQYGKFKVGKFEEAIKYAIEPTDFFEDSGCTGLAGNDDKRESVLQYQWSGYGMDAIVSYALAKNDIHVDGAYFVDENVDMDYSVSAAVGYTSPDMGFGPIGVRLGYIYGKLADGNHRNNFIDYDVDPATGAVTDHVNYDDYKQFAVSAFWGSLDAGPYVAAVYQQRKFASKFYETSGTSDGPDTTVSGFEITFAYTFDNGLKLATGYERQKFELDSDSAHGIEGGDVVAATIPLMAIWSVNPKFDVWAEARFDAGTDDDDVSEGDGKNFDDDTKLDANFDKTVFSFGMRYMF